MLRCLVIGKTPSKLPPIYGACIWDIGGQAIVGTLKVVLLSIIILAGIAAWRAGVLA
jgi:hypothetical protein